MKPEILEFSEWIAITEPVLLKKLIGQLLKQSGYEVVGFIDHHFTPAGYTAIWLVKESHLAIHTFPEANKTYLQLSSCNKDKHAIFVSTLAKSIKRD